MPNTSTSHLLFFEGKIKERPTVNASGCPMFNFLLTLNTRLKILPYKHTEAETPQAALPSIYFTLHIKPLFKQSPLRHLNVTYHMC